MGVGHLSRARWRAMLRVRRLQRAGDAMGCARELVRVGALTERIAKEAKMAKTHRSAVTGQFVSPEDAAADPDRHVAQAVDRRPAVDLRVERMNPHMVKLHLGTPDKPRVVHWFNGPDHGDPHDHKQWGFWSTVIEGSYIEERYRLDGSHERIHRQKGDRFYVETDAIHRIVELPEGECWTMIEPDAHTGQASGFFRWKDGVMLSRRWHEAEFMPHQP